MLSLLLLFLAILLSSIFERIGAIALELTGMPGEQAEFQALSAFSGVGFTTKEAEYALGHPQRRKIIMMLISFGSAGVITTSVAFLGTVLSSKSILETLARDPHYSWMPVNFPTLVLILAIAFLYAFYRGLKKPAIARLAKELVSAALLKSKIVKPLSLYEVIVNGNGSGVFQVEVTEENPLLGKTIQGAGLRDFDITVLYVNRMSESIDLPPENFRFEPSDIVTLYGPSVMIHDHCVALKGKKKETVEKAGEDGMLAPGTKAPEFTLSDQRGRPVSLADFRGKRNLLMVFYPKDKSFFCTAQLRTLSEHLGEFDALGTDVVALNQESASSHSDFCDSENLKFSLLSDPAKKVIRSYRAAMLGGFVVDRTVYIIDRDGVIRYAKRGKPAVTELLGALKQISDSAGSPA